MYASKPLHPFLNLIFAPVTHMWTLTNNSNKNTINSSLAQLRTRRHIKAPVKLGISLRLQLAYENMHGPLLR